MNQAQPEGRKNRPGQSRKRVGFSYPSRADTFTESVIREMTRLAVENNAINLAQGFPDFPCPEELKARPARLSMPISINIPSPGVQKT